MKTRLEELVNDLEEEHCALKGLLEHLVSAEWDVPTHTPRWTVRDQLVHLAFFDEAATGR